MTTMQVRLARSGPILASSDQFTTRYANKQPMYPYIPVEPPTETWYGFVAARSLRMLPQIAEITNIAIMYSVL